MANELGGLMIGQLVARDAMNKALNGKAKKKKASVFSRIVKNLTK